MRRDRGFSMLEVLVALLVLNLGVLGIAALQMMSVNNTEVGRYESVATMLASSMEAAMQANVAYWGSPPPSITVSGTTIAGGPASYTGSCVGSLCTATQMAAYDLQNWAASLAGSLPSGQATITCTQNVSPPVCTLSLSWLEKNISLHNAKGTESGQLATGTASLHGYQSLVSIIQ